MVADWVLHIRFQSLYEDAMLAGGHGSRTAVHDATLLDWLKSAAASSKSLTFLASVCTGSAILAKAGDMGAAIDHAQLLRYLTRLRSQQLISAAASACLSQAHESCRSAGWKEGYHKQTSFPLGSKPIGSSELD